MPVLGGTQQFAFFYLQPAAHNALHFTDANVGNDLTVTRNFLLDNTHLIWPANPDATNFRVAKVNYDPRLGENRRHSEYQLLDNNGLDRMRQGLAACPQFVLIYSTLLPCMRARDQHGVPRPRAPNRCLENINAAKARFLNHCPHTVFYIYTNQNTPRSNCQQDQNYFQWEQNYMAHNNIHWLHP